MTVLQLYLHMALKDWAGLCGISKSPNPNHIDVVLPYDVDKVVYVVGKMLSELACIEP